MRLADGSGRGEAGLAPGQPHWRARAPLGSPSLNRPTTRLAGAEHRRHRDPQTPHRRSSDPAEVPAVEPPGPAASSRPAPGAAEPAPSPPLSLRCPGPSAGEPGGAAGIGLPLRAGPGRRLQPWEVPGGRGSAAPGQGAPPRAGPGPGRVGAAPPSRLPPPGCASLRASPRPRSGARRRARVRGGPGRCPLPRPRC